MLCKVCRCSILVFTLTSHNSGTWAGGYETAHWRYMQQFFFKVSIGEGNLLGVHLLWAHDDSSSWNIAEKSLESFFQAWDMSVKNP